MVFLGGLINEAGLYSRRAYRKKIVKDEYLYIFHNILLYNILFLSGTFGGMPQVFHFIQGLYSKRAYRKMLEKNAPKSANRAYTRGGLILE